LNPSLETFTLSFILIKRTPSFSFTRMVSSDDNSREKSGKEINKKERRDFNPSTEKGKIRNFFAIGHAVLKDIPRKGCILWQPKLIPLLNLIYYHLEPI